MGKGVEIDSIILNRRWLYDNDDEEVGEVNFEVDAAWLKEYWEQNFKDDGTTYSDFLDVYVPETDGEQIYQAARVAGKLISDIGPVYNK